MLTLRILRAETHFSLDATFQYNADVSHVMMIVIVKFVKHNIFVESACE